MNGTLRSMQYDQRSELPTRDVADYVIVGTGAGGAAAGRVLAAAGHDVIFIEEGRHYPTEVRRPDAWTSLREAWRDGGLQVSSSKGAFFPIIQGCAVGGTTAINGAIIHEVPEEIHEKWISEHGMDSGLHSMDQWARVYQTLDEELNVAPAPADVLGKNNELFYDACEAAGIVSNGIRRCVRGCRGAARCSQGCPFGAKQSTDLTLIDRAMRDGARVFATCRARKLKRDGTRVVGVDAEFRDPVTGRTGHRVHIEARKAVILAASAVHTPWLLLRSGIRTPSRQVGRNFRGHPGSGIIAEFADRVDMWRGVTQGWETTQYWHELMKFEVVGVPPAVAASRLPGYGEDYRRRVNTMRHCVHWGVQIRAHAVGRIRRGIMGGPAISYGLAPQDVPLLKTGLKRLVNMAFGVGAQRVMPGVHGLPGVLRSADEMRAIDDLPNDPKLFHGICGHLFGTTALGSDDRRAVVDSTGAVYGTTGLHVMDASVLPTNMGVNPQHTISAICWRMAESIA